MCVCLGSLAHFYNYLNEMNWRISSQTWTLSCLQQCKDNQATDLVILPFLFPFYLVDPTEGNISICMSKTSIYFWWLAFGRENMWKISCSGDWKKCFLFYRHKWIFPPSKTEGKIIPALTAYILCRCPRPEDTICFKTSVATYLCAWPVLPLLTVFSHHSSRIPFAATSDNFSSRAF